MPSKQLHLLAALGVEEANVAGLLPLPRLHRLRDEPPHLVLRGLMAGSDALYVVVAGKNPLGQDQTNARAMR